jgi:hypothetical protein
MPLTINMLLRDAGIPLADVRLVRHKDKRAVKGRTPYELWRDNRPQFELYQSIQSIPNRKKLRGRYWAVFIVNLSNETMFAGLYGVEFKGLLKQDTPRPHMDGVDKRGSCIIFDLTLLDTLSEFIGRLFVDWGDGALAWVQYASRQIKPITELRTEFKEEAFPGFLNLIRPLSDVGKFPKTWIEPLRNSRGVYLLTCPITKEQYVGSATGADGFWGRWQSYVQTGHGNNLELLSREPSDYQVSILEVAGTGATTDDITAMEGLWQRKLQSREMGLNRNLARR